MAVPVGWKAVIGDGGASSTVVLASPDGLLRIELLAFDRDVAELFLLQGHEITVGRIRLADGVERNGRVIEIADLDGTVRRAMEAVVDRPARDLLVTASSPIGEFDSCQANLMELLQSVVIWDVDG